ncbi:multidrug transporter [Agaribacterium haliotis]|uniref:multidrug transporter n=1 Tax=Agaribacterium haliotis TaxID=2013869 RepID=UPI000BB55ABF|nr:multidrug transporter [Agaribacterium haliotis]
MYQAAVYILALLIGGLALFASVKILKRFGWFLAWLRGTVGLLLLVFVVLVALTAFDIGRFEQLLEDKPIATVSFEKLDDQLYRANISYYINKLPAQYDISGDQWQIDARIVRWGAFVSALGAKPGIRLDRISGRYYSLEEERMKPRSVFGLYDSDGGVDMWALLQRNNELVPGIDAVYGSAAYLPMADQASFQLSLSYNGLVAEPTNEIARKAIKLWR